VTAACQIATTLGSEAAAADLAARLVDERLAACVQVVGPVRSTYRWKGAVEQATEWLCLAKTSTDRLDAALSRIRALHPYEVPEIAATPITAGDPDYLAWIQSATTT
jgi:periplasmic divalent cation tolerance protein